MQRSLYSAGALLRPNIAGIAFGAASFFAVAITLTPHVAIGGALSLVFWAGGFALFVLGGLCTVHILMRYDATARSLMALSLINAMLGVSGLGVLFLAAGAGTEMNRVLPIAAIAAFPIQLLAHILVFRGDRSRAGIRAALAGSALALSCGGGLFMLAPGAMAAIGPDFLAAPSSAALLVCIGAGLLTLTLQGGSEAKVEMTAGKSDTMMDQLPPGVLAVLVDGKGVIKDATAAAQDMFGVSADGASPERVIHFTPVEGRVKALMQGAKLGELHQFVDRAGVSHCARLHRREIQEGQPDSYALIVIDLIDILVDRQDKLRALGIRMRSTIDANSDILFLLSKNGLVLELNRGALEYVRKARTECIGDYIWNLFCEHEKKGPPHVSWRALFEASSDKQSVTSEMVLQGGEGVRRLFRMGVSRVLTGNGENPEILCFGQDITEITQTRKSFQAAQARLEQTIDRRTTELSQAKQAADDANMSKSRFLANMSHELRTPLNAILGYTDLMMQDLADDGKTESQEYEDMGRVIINARNLLTLINDILDLSKVEANKMTLSYVDMTVKDLIIEMKASVDPLIAKNGNVLKLALADGLDVVRIDQQKVRQCLLNLLSNAAKFTQAGEISIKIWQKINGEEKYIFFEVADSGRGMTEQQCASIFDEFVQIEDGESPNVGGTGLGLPITKRFAQLMGGDIKAQSTPGSGSRFTMWVRNGPAVEVNTAPKEAVA